MNVNSIHILSSEFYPLNSGTQETVLKDYPWMKRDWVWCHNIQWSVLLFHIYIFNLDKVVGKIFVKLTDDKKGRVVSVVEDRNKLEID